jgi:hypothetical protein
MTRLILKLLLRYERAVGCVVVIKYSGIAVSLNKLVDNRIRCIAHSSLSTMGLLNKLKGKSKGVPVHTIKEYGGGGKAAVILNLCIKQRRVVSFTS